jgi:hypothetical protein
MSAPRRSALLVLCLVLTTTAGFAQQLGENPLLMVVPQLRGMAAPEWLQEGTRVTYHTASATLPADAIYHYQDARGLPRWDDEVGPAGAAMLQWVCVHRSPEGVVGTFTSYAADIADGTLLPGTPGGSVDPAGAGACWANPAALATLDGLQSGNTQVLRMPHTIGERVFNAIRFHHVGDRSIDSLVYDLDSGLLLFHRNAAISADGRYTLLKTRNFVALRQAPPPVVNAPAPDWVGSTAPISYHGASASIVSGAQLMPIAATATFEKIDGGARWAKYRVTRQSSGQIPDTIEMICGAGSFTGEPWMAPALLRALTAGQVLDRDPDIGVVITVEEVAPGPGGAEIVVISHEGKGFKESRAYDRATGRLLMLTSAQQVGIALRQMQMQLAQ